jgi:hypothetical protein
VTSGDRSFVFHDPSGRRWARFQGFMQTAGLVFGLLLTLVVLASLTGAAIRCHTLCLFARYKGLPHQTLA